MKSISLGKMDKIDSRIMQISAERKLKDNFDISKASIPFSEFFNPLLPKDIYKGEERIPFKNRHPIFKSLMTIEFEDAMREYCRKNR